MNAAGNDDRSPVLAAALRQRYDDRLRRGIDSVRRMVEETTQRDARVLEAMKSDPDTAKFAVARSQEIMDSAVTSEKEEEIVSLLHTLAQRDVDVKVLEDEAVRLREEVASLKEKQRDDSDDLAKRVQMHERVMQGEIALKAEVAEMRQSLTTTADAFRKREQDLRLAMDEEHKKDVEYIRENAAEELQRAHERALQQEERMREEQAHALEQTDKGHAREIERMVKEKIADRESMQAHGLEGEVARLEKTLMRCEERETESRTALAAQREEFNSTVLADRKELEAAHVKALALEVEMARAQHAETELRAERDGLRVKYVAMGKRCEELSIKLLKQREAYANVHRDVAQTAHEKLRAWKARSAERARASDDAVEAARNEAAAELLAHSIELGQLQTQIAQMRETSARHRQAYERYEELRERHEELVASSAKNEESHVQIELELRRVVSSAKAADARHVAELTVFEEKAKMQRALDAATRENKFLNREVELSREVEMRRVGDGGPLQARQLMPGGSIGFSSEEGGKERTRMRTRRGSSAHARSSSSSLRPSSVETPAPRGSRYRDGRRDRDRDSDRDAHHGGVMYSDVREAQRRADEAEKEVKELKEKMEAEKAALEAKVAELQETVAGHVHAHASLAGERAHLVQHVTHGSATVERLTAMVESEKDRVREARAMAEAEAAAHERVHANALAGLDALDAARCAQAAAASAALRAQAAAALTIAEQHRRALERRCAEREYAHSELSGELESHRAQIETHHSEMSRVRERHDEAHSRLHANGHRHRSVHSAVQQLRSDVAALRRDATLSMRVVRDAMENDIARLGIKLPGHTGAAVTQHKAKLAVELKAQHDRALEAVHREHTQALEDARSELLATQRKHAETHESREEVSRRKEELARSLQDVRAKLATTEDAHAVHRGKHEEHLSAHMMTQMQILAHRKMVRALSGEVRKLRVDVALRMEDTMREVNATMTTMASKTVAVAIARGHMHAEALAKCAQLQQRFDALQVHSDKLELDVLRIPVLHAKNASLQRSLDASADLLRAVFTKISPGSVLSPEALSVIAGARVDDDFYASNGVASLPKLFDALAERQSAGGGRPVDTAPSGVLRADRVCREFASALAELHSAKGVALRDGLLRRRMGEFESLHEQALIEAAGTRDAADRVPLALIADAPAVHVGRHAASYRERALSMRVKAPHFMMPSPTAAAPSSVVVWMEAHWHHQLELVAQRHSLRASAEAEGEARTQERDASLERAESSRRARTRQIIAAAERVDIYATHNRALDVAETSEVDADVEHRVVVDLNDLRAAHRVQQSSRDRLRTIMQDMSTLAADIERTITETGSAAAGEEERARSVRERSEVAREAESLATQRLNELRALVGAQAKSRARTYEAAFERFAEGMGVHNRAAAKESAQKVVDEWQAEVGCFERTSGGVDGRGGNENSTNGDGLKGLVIPEDEVSTVDDLIAKSVAVRAFDKAFQFEHTAADYDGEAATRRREEEDDEGVNPLSQTNQSICTVLHAMRLKADHVHAVVEELGDDGVSLLSLMDKPGEASALTRATQDELERCVSAIRDELVLAVEVQERRHLDQWEQARAAENAAIEHLKQQREFLQHHQAEAVATRAQLGDLEAAVDEAKAVNELLTLQRADAEARADAATSTIAHLETTVASHIDVVGEHAVQVTQGKMAALEHETVVAKLEGRVAHHANAAEQAVRKISALAVQVGALEMQIGALEEQRLLDLQACTDATEAASSAQTLCEDETKRRELLEAEVTKARVQLADADAKITALSATLAVAERQHAERGAELGILGESAARVTELEQLVAQGAVLKVRLETSEAALAKCTSSAKYLTAKLNIAESRVKSLTSRQAEDAATRVQQLDEISRLKRDLVEAKSAHEESSRRLELHGLESAAGSRVAALSSSFGSTVVARTKLMRRLHRHREERGSGADGISATAVQTVPGETRSRLDLAELDAQQRRIGEQLSEMAGGGDADETSVDSIE